MATIARRDFLKAAGLAGAAFAGSTMLAGCAPKSAETVQAATAASSGLPEMWDEEVEVLVVGSGYAGLAAAYEAAKAGSGVRIIDKRASGGGNSAFADGQIAVVGSAAQKAAGIEDSVEAFVSDSLTAGLNLNYESKVRLIAEKSNETFEWTVNEIGVEWAQDAETGSDRLIAQGGHTVMRCIPPQANSGSGITEPLTAKLAEQGIQVETDTQLARLFKDDAGRVVGVQIALGCRDYDLSTAKETKTVKTSRGVVLATGGFGLDVAFRSAQDPRLDETVGCTNREGSNADGLRVALDAGAFGMQLDQIQCYPYTSPVENSFGSSATWIEAECAYAPVIDPATGKRFVNELTDRKRFSDAIFELGHPALQIGCIDNAPEWARESLEAGLGNGAVVEFDTLDAIASEYDIPLEALKAQIDSYNACVEAGIDTEFGKLFNDDSAPMKNAPYYVAKMQPKVHHCMGGVKTDDNCRVIGNDLQPISGLYAAGEATGGVHGACRLGCNGTLDCLVNGRIAGQQVALSDPLA
ncbi:flavocytochrome c [Gordonibacter sp. An230]|uniref:flavocytochrome c n=1 Tax=Gordonibacter sp. An230 TaxID=1965592 RepID=UPI0013A66C06|nr:flavocytochrome c [Gordonibacter sp. An230]